MEYGPNTTLKSLFEHTEDQPIVFNRDIGNSSMFDKGPVPGCSAPTREKLNENTVDIKKLLKNKTVTQEEHGKRPTFTETNLE
jgi:hypothetical protein